MKRLTDIVLAAVILPVAVPICIVAALAIRLESRGNPLFLQRRVGRGQREFVLWKMRSMSIDTEHVSSHEVSRAQITRVGRFIRKTKIDELPQVVNVLWGQMSFVGPRPCLPSQTTLIEERRKRGVFDGRPGITGLAQIAGVDMSSPQRLAEIDAQYLGQRTWWGDLRLILQTALGRGQGDAANQKAVW